MSAAHRRAARREGQLANALKTERVKNRGRYERAPDVLPIRLSSGITIQGESKSRKSLPAWLTSAVEKTASYTPGAIPVVALYQFGSAEALAVVRLRDLLVLLGLDQPPAGEQLVIGSPT